MQTAKAPRERKERKENADKRRRELIAATMRSVNTNGLSRTTLATVASEAGLSQGVAVFYFKTKEGLLEETLRAQYENYEANWTKELARAGADPVDQLLALVRADFAPSICNRESLAVWFAFWGELKFHPNFAQISRTFDATRGDAIEAVCAKLMVGADRDAVMQAATCIDTFTDGMWQKLYLTPDSFDVDQAVAVTMGLLGQLFPKHRVRMSGDQA